MIGFDRSTTREVVRWVISGALILALHGGAAAVIHSWSEPMPAGAPQDAILLDLSPSSGAPPVPQSDVAPDVVDQQFQEERPEPDPVKEVEKEELQPPQKMAEVTPEPPPPEPPMQKAEVSLPPPTLPKPQPKPKKKQVAALDKRRTSNDAVAERPAAASPGMAGAAKATYNQLIVAHLNRHKNYPSTARSNRVEGTVMLSFTLDRGGHVTGSHIARGSGSSELDREALDMLKRAQPFPAPPAVLTDSRFPFTAPMRYYLN
jgi:protein TonB